MAVAAERHAALLDELTAEGCPSWTVGEVTHGAAGSIALHGE
jgi:hypothetical protein